MIEPIRTVYKVVYRGETLYEGTLERAIRTWDGAPFNLSSQGAVPGDGIEVRSWTQDGTMVRDGWLVHLLPNGHVFINPRLTDGETYE